MYPASKNSAKESLRISSIIDVIGKKMEFEITIIHVILHITTILVAFCLFILSAISYSRDRRIKLLYITAAFLLFCIKEILQALILFVYTSTDPIIIHPLNLIILILFFIGVTK